MAKSMVERYEQLLRQDPTSSVFVELAKALLEKGEAARAIEVCGQGISHHPTSTVGRVLWGKALIQLGRPAEAMEQFDQAISIEKDNPYAYNLIGEVLLQRGLYRSALPILRKAVTLQPNDGRVKLWLEQAQQALAGGPAPVFADLMGLEKPKADDDAEAPEGAQESGAAAPMAAARLRAAALGDTAKVKLAEGAEAGARKAGAARANGAAGAQAGASGAKGAGAAANGAAGAQAGAAGVKGAAGAQADVSGAPSAAGARAGGPGADGAAGATSRRTEDAGAEGDSASGAGAEGADSLEAAGASGAPGEHAGVDSTRDVADSLGLMNRSVPTRTSSGAELPGLDLSLDDEDGDQATGAAGTPPSEAPRDASGESFSASGEAPEGADAGQDASGSEAGGRDEGLQAAPPEGTSELPLLLSGEFTTAKPTIPASGGGLLGDLPPPEPTGAAPVAKRSTPVRPSGGKRSLLDDIPDATAQTAQVAAAKTAPKQDTEALTAAYEKELRAKLEREAAKTSFIARHGVKAAGAVVAVVVLAIIIGGFLKYRADQGGQTLNETLARTEDLIIQDSRGSLDAALAQLARAREMDESSSRAWALTAWTHALLFADHGMSPEDRRQALEALEKPGVKEGSPALVLTTNVLVADDRGREPARRALLAAQEDSTEVHALAGGLLLEAKDEKKALERFDRALRASAANVRALVALGNYYLVSEDFPQAIEMFERARKKSPEHAGARIGLAEARLALDQDLNAALADVAPLATDAKLPAALKGRQQLVHGELLAAQGKHDEARALLSKGAQGPLAFEFQLALGATGRAAGKLDVAQAAYEAALKLQPKSDEAREGLGRTLLDRDREREVLTRLEGDGGRKVALVRGAAYAKLGDWKKARAELARTRVNDRYPPEAVSWLALADAAEGNATQAREVLEKALAAAKRPRNDMRLALGQVYLRERAFDKAQAQFEEAQKDPRDYEASCSLGRLLLMRGLPDMALKPLTQAVERNGAHGEARDALGRTLLALGRTPEALKQFEAWQLENPGSAGAHKGFALALYHAGRRKEAEGAVGRATKLAPEDAEAHRLRAAILFAAGDARGGFSALERANRLDPKDPDTFCEIAHAFLRQGNADNADAAFAAARREGPDATCGRVGELYAQLPAGGRPAARTLEDLAARAPTTWDKAFARAAMARVLLGAGALKDARAAADEAVKLAPHEGRSHLALGLVALKQRQEAEAKAALSKAVELEPTDGPAHLALADLLVRESAELPRAIESYEAFLRLAGGSQEAARVKKALPSLKKKAAR
ncbi:tetratricopeptide repeat protein [Pyxidicoccus fallax]|uniref:Tetratricopeptide repeat protein n=1 Tax=Pyxidicoccus fallax TaxID=394095 RepID=A0A848LXQ1_9BACT|nr:tetratricopeptide repeat protein [Pyxidicoccus fallax]NMO22391.1 tetratricopeptide repeat protein [Pyxidicoccus fallax]NPC84250.1 tetratricopeptide repeat protein [Pyxidicoccus fallax]